MSIERDGFAIGDLLREFVRPRHDLPGTKLFQIRTQRHRALSQIHRLKIFLKMEQSITSRQVKQPFTQTSKNQLLSRTLILVLKPGNRGEVKLQIRRLVTIILQTINQTGKILTSLLTIQMRHAKNGLGQVGMQVGVQFE